LFRRVKRIFKQRLQLAKEQQPEERLRIENKYK